MKKANFFSSPWWAAGDKLSNAKGLFLNENAARARAGLLNILSIIAFVSYIIFNNSLLLYLAIFVIFDMVTAVIFGLTPFSLTGILGTLLVLYKDPVFVAATPKRIAWSIGATLALMCLLGYYYELKIFVATILCLCFIFTWLEAVIGFCIVCWIYNIFVECVTCKVVIKSPKDNNESD